MTAIEIANNTMTVEDATEGIVNASRKADKWMKGLNDYFSWKPTVDDSRMLQVFFGGTGVNATVINWDQFNLI